MRIFLLLVMVCLLASCDNASVTDTDSDNDIPPIANPTNKVLLVSEVKWEQLNPARGDKSPMAGTLWGDRNGTEATGFLLKTIDGFQSPPHIHNVSYRGCMISGLIHNDDPDAEKMWMPKGSFWTQPAGEVHITAGKGDDVMAYIEIEKAPYLVLPVEEAFDNGERPVNVHESNIVWLRNTDINRGNNKESSTKKYSHMMAFLWGEYQEGKMNGTFLKLPAGFSGNIIAYGSAFRAIVVQGQPEYQLPDNPEILTLNPGSNFSSEGKSVHILSCGTDEDCIFYVRAEGTYDIVPL